MIESCMNLRSASFALAILLLGILSHSMINSSFAQTVPNRDNVPTGAPPTDTVSNLKSPMQIARDSANAGMKTVTDKMKIEKGLKNKLRAVTSTSKDVMRSQMQKAIPSNMTGAQESKDNLKSEMQTAKDSSITGMKTVTDKMKIEKRMEDQTGIQQKNVGSVTS